MNVTVLDVENCPNLAPLMEKLDDLLAGRGDVVVETRLVTSDAEAEQLGFHGSPTILIGGHDPFQSPEEFVGPSCRMYDAGGETRGSPTRSQLATILQATS
jgi:hypothetical protein